MNFNFTDYHIVITAGASGIGYEIAKAFAVLDATIFVCDISAEKVAAVSQQNNKIHAFVADVGDASQVEAFYDFIKTKTDTINVLVNNAGIAGPTALTENITPEEWDRTVSVDLNGMFYAAKHALPMLRKAGGGAIVNMSSNAAFSGFPFRSPYTASKWAIIGFTKTLAMEYGAENIRVNAVCPGSVKGERIDGVIAKEAELRGLTFEEVKSGYERQVSLRSFVDASDVSNLILYLSSPYGKMISGQAMGIDGHTETLTNF
jgi:NAD(P)-dependent dehydrogenase (short-subunit alcohol dehydrogenase family)